MISITIEAQGIEYNPIVCKNMILGTSGEEANCLNIQEISGRLGAK